MTLETLNETPYTYSGDGKLTGEDVRIAMDLARAYTLMEVLANATERIDELDLGSATPTATIACDAIRQQIGYLKKRMEHDMERRAPALGLPGVVE